MSGFSNDGGYGYVTAEWDLAADTVGASAQAFAALIFAAVQFSGTFGGATATVELSLDGENWLTMFRRDSAGFEVPGNATEPTMLEFATVAPFIRIVTAGGDSTTAIKATIVAYT